MSSKVKIIYTPDGGSKRTWEVDLENPPWDITFNTEKVTGWPWVEFSEKLGKMSVIALRALIWTLRKRDEPRLDLESVTVMFSELELDLDLDDEPVADGDGPKETA